MKKIMLAAMMICGAVALAGCNTVAGFGTDLKKGANHVGTALESIGFQGPEQSGACQVGRIQTGRGQVSPFRQANERDPLRTSKRVLFLSAGFRSG